MASLGKQMDVVKVVKPTDLEVPDEIKMPAAEEKKEKAPASKGS